MIPVGLFKIQGKAGKLWGIYDIDFHLFLTKFIGPYHLFLLRKSYPNHSNPIRLHFPNKQDKIVSHKGSHILIESA
jgi:hypothetical protein